MLGMSQRSARRTLARVFELVARTFAQWADSTRPPGKVLVLGGARSGKSGHAERLISRYPEVTYLATGNPTSADDPEWAERIRLHRERRPARWRTVETADPAAVLRESRTPVLLDCLATWLDRVLDDAGAWQETEGWQQRVEDRVTEFLDAWRAATVPIIAVSNEVGSGVVPATPSGRVFRDVLGSLNSRVAEHADRVLLVVAGRALDLGK
ncbi:MAG: bifunctional adenosylcobinamide kinase/adenosylcobinamide-phosphate guanylyltransferase [Haloechinothrix sp.]